MVRTVTMTIWQIVCNPPGGGYEISAQGEDASYVWTLPGRAQQIPELGDTIQITVKGKATK